MNGPHNNRLYLKHIQNREIFVNNFQCLEVSRPPLCLRNIHSHSHVHSKQFSKYCVMQTTSSMCSSPGINSTATQQHGVIRYYGIVARTTV